MKFRSLVYVLVAPCFSCAAAEEVGTGRYEGGPKPPVEKMERVSVETNFLWQQVLALLDGGREAD